MEKRKLKKMKVLEPSEEMVLAAESDIPAIGNMAYERMEYPIGLFIQAEMDENILKIGSNLAFLDHVEILIDKSDLAKPYAKKMENLE